MLTACGLTASAWGLTVLDDEAGRVLHVVDAAVVAPGSAYSSGQVATGHEPGRLPAVLAG